MIIQTEMCLSFLSRVILSFKWKKKDKTSTCSCHENWPRVWHSVQRQLFLWRASNESFVKTLGLEISEHRNSPRANNSSRCAQLTPRTLPARSRALDTRAQVFSVHSTSSCAQWSRARLDKITILHIMLDFCENLPLTFVFANHLASMRERRGWSRLRNWEFTFKRCERSLSI